MNDLKIFENDMFGQLTIINSDEHGILFLGSEVAEMAGYKAPTMAIRNLADKYKLKLSYDEAKELFLMSENPDIKNFLHQKYANGISLVNEPGLYKLASGKNEAFENWIFFEVLPSIRKEGSYDLEEQNVLTRRLLDNMTRNLEQLTGVMPAELAITQNESWNKRLSNLLIDCSTRGMGSVKELYDELFHVFADQTGIYIPEVAELKGFKRMEYLRRNKELSKMVYDFAHNHFSSTNRQIILVPLDMNQKTLVDFGGL